MRTLIRSCIVITISDPPEQMAKNIQALDKSGLVPEIKEERTIWDVVRSFYRQHRHAPEITTVEAELTKTHDLSSLDYLAQLSRDVVKFRGDFEVLVERELEKRRSEALMTALKTASAVNNTGLEIDNKTLRGVDAAADVLRTALRGLVKPPAVKISGYIHEDVGEMAKAYDHAKMNPVTGNFCGLQQIDTSIRGSKNRQLWVHAAYSSHMKSTFALNWCYHLATFFSSSVVFFSLEMNYDECQSQIAAMHSYHFNFRQLRIDLGIQAADDEFGRGLDYEKIRDGGLSPREEEFYKQYVLPDLADERNRYGKIRVEVADPGKRFRVADIEARAEALYAEDPFVKIFVDHSLLIDGSRQFQNTSDCVGEVLADLKNLARGFRRGAGMDVTVLHQINRVGFDAALKKKEAGKGPRYEMSNLSQSAGTEQAADVVTSTWLDDDLRRNNLVLFDCIKNRFGALFHPFHGRVIWPCRRVLTCNTPFVEKPAESTVAGRRRRPSGVGTEVLDTMLDATGHAEVG